MNSPQTQSYKKNNRACNLNREATRLRVARWREKNREEAREQNRKNARKHAKENYHKIRARWSVKNAIKRGRVERGICQICGAEGAEAHHSNYSDPLKIEWFCKTHHEAWHRLFLAEGQK